MKRGFVDVPVGQMHYRAEGSGEPLLFLHMTQSSSLHFVQVIPFFSQHYWAIAPDYPGYGDSDPAPHLYSMEEYAQSVLSFMDALGIQQAYMGGGYFGAAISLRCAAGYPERVRAIFPPTWPGASSVTPTWPPSCSSPWTWPSTKG